MTTNAQWVKDEIDALESEQARVTAMAEQEHDTWIAVAFKERLGQIRTHLSELRRRT